MVTDINSKRLEEIRATLQERVKGEISVIVAHLEGNSSEVIEGFTDSMLLQLGKHEVGGENYNRVVRGYLGSFLTNTGLKLSCIAMDNTQSINNLNINFKNKTISMADFAYGVISEARKVLKRE